MFHATTIVAVKRHGTVVIAGDGQVSMQNTIVKATAKKLRRLHEGKIIAGFAGSTADALTLFDLFENKLKQHGGDLARAAVELAKDWRSDKMLRRLEALLLVACRERILLISGAGDVIEPDGDCHAIGSGGGYALAAARALVENTQLGAREIAEKSLHVAADICTFTNHEITSEEASMTPDKSFTPREVVSELDRYIVGQPEAKRAVAIALRNRWRRRRVEGPLKEEITPKNILLMGPTGCGKTEIARRLARLANAPFIKVEATKFTEVGYVGRDVDSMVRDLVDVSIKMVREEAQSVVQDRAAGLAEERMLDLLLPKGEDRSREKMREMLRSGALDEREVDIDVAPPSSTPVLSMLGSGTEMGVDMASGLQDAIASALGGSKKKKRKMKVAPALQSLVLDEASKLVDQDQVKADGLLRAEEQGIIFIDEIDKIASPTGGRGGPDVSREGVQRDILPIIEGSTVTTKHGQLKTDHILFICAGAFHMSKPSDLIPELQGRLPIRVELSPLTKGDFVRILKETESSLVRQYTALLATEAVELRFTDDGIEAVASMAAEVNQAQENIGARRLATIMERLLEEESFDAPDRKGMTVVIDAAFVERKLAPILKREDLSRYIL